MRKLLFKFMITILIFVLAACGKGEHMPVVTGGFSQPGQGDDGAAVTGKTVFADVKPIFKKSCGKCHPGAGPDWQIYSVAFAKKDLIYDRVFVKKDMPIGGGLSDNDKKIIGKWLSDGALNDTAGPVIPPTTPPVLGVGATIYINNCASCHGGNGIATLPTAPNLAGQKEDYILLQLKDFKSGVRPGTMMPGAIAKLSDVEIEEVSKYVASLVASQSSEGTESSAAQFSDEERSLIKSWLESEAYKK